MSNRVHRFVSNDFTVRAAVVNATEVVQEMQQLQKAGPLASLGVGRSMSGALLMASHLKPGQEVGVLLRGNGPLGSIYGQASFEGHVRGYCPHPQYIAPDSADALNLKKAMGHGQLTVTRQQPFQKQPHTGTVEMVSGEVGEDLAHYLHQSQQIRSLVSLGVFFDSYGMVKAAGGLLIEVMPGVEDAIVNQIQKNADQVKTSISTLIMQGSNHVELITPYLQGIAFTEIDHDYPVKYFCPCTTDRVKRALGTLGLQDLNEMIAEEEPTEVSCQMCGRVYQVTTEELQSLREELRKSSMH